MQVLQTGSLEYFLSSLFVGKPSYFVDVALRSSQLHGHLLQLLQAELRGLTWQAQGAQLNCRLGSPYEFVPCKRRIMSDAGCTIFCYTIANVQGTIWSTEAVVQLPDIHMHLPA